jgi:hypothetical protein
MPNRFIEFHKGMTVCSTNGFQGLKPKSTFQNERFLGLAPSFKSPKSSDSHKVLHQVKKERKPISWWIWWL